jgi:ribonuclease-3 family protein
MLWSYPNEDALRMPPLVLAYVGDAVFELFVRSRLVSDGGKVDQLHRRAIGMVSAKAMSEYYRKLAPSLTGAENEVLHRGRNVKSRQIKSAGVAQYHMSTGFEALVGYLFLSRQDERLEQLLRMIVDAEDGAEQGTEESTEDGTVGE